MVRIRAQLTSYGVNWDQFGIRGRVWEELIEDGREWPGMVIVGRDQSDQGEWGLGESDLVDKRR